MREVERTGVLSIKEEKNGVVDNSVDEGSMYTSLSVPGEAGL